MTSAGYIGIGTTSPTVSLTVVGEVQVSNSGVSCSSTTAGAIRYTSGNLQYCNGTAFTSLVSGTTGLTLDNITSGTTKVTANSNGYISLTTGGSTTGYFDTSGRMVVPGISVTTAQTSVTSLYASGNVGVLTPSPTSALSVNGNIQLKTGEGLLIGVGTENDNTFSYVGASATVTLQHYSLSWKVADYSSGAQAHLSGWNGIQLYSRGAARATIDPTGRVGIATVYPSSTLHVSGTARITSWTMIGAAATPSATLDVSGTLKVAGTGSETCATENLGSFRRNPITGKMQICR